MNEEFDMRIVKQITASALLAATPRAELAAAQVRWKHDHRDDKFCGLRSADALLRNGQALPQPVSQT
jgi:hypothetical protein